MAETQLKYSSRFLSLFERWLRLAFRIRFESVCFAGGDTLPRDRTVVVVANHMSWWDGFLILMLRRRLSVGAPIYPVMLEEQLRKHPWLRRVGCIGITPGSVASTRGLFAVLADACEKEPGSWIVYFPQGEITPSWKRPLGFRRGIELLLRALPDPVVLPVALHIEPLTTSRPTAFLLAGDACDADGMTVREVEALVTQQIDRLQDHILRTGENAAGRWVELDVSAQSRTRQRAGRSTSKTTIRPDRMDLPANVAEGGGAMRKKAIVIGSGFGGLAIANRLASRGMDVTVFEKRARVGGRAYQFEESGYVFDMGPSLITAPEIIEDIFARAGRRLADYTTLIPLDPFYRVYFHDGTWIDYSGDAEAMKAQMRKFSPEDASNYDAFMAAAGRVYDAVIVDKLGARPFDTVRSMVDFVPRAFKLGAYKPMSMFAASFFKDPRHRFLFSFHPLFLGGNPFRSPAVYAMIPFLEKKQGVWFTPGGMYSLVRAFETLLLNQGGTVRTDSEVSEIVVDGGRAIGVRCNGIFHGADIVVSNSDVGHLYRDLIKPLHRKKWTDRKVNRTHYTMSCFLLYLGVRGSYPKLKHHTLILTKRYRELLKDIFDRKILPEDFSMYLHVPTRTDPSMAPEGCESIYVLVPVANLQSGINWTSESEPFADRILAFLEAWGMPGLRQNLEVKRLFTPDDFESQLNSMHGNAFGIEPRLSQTAYLRPHNRSEDVENLYLVGAGTHPGAGVPGVLLSAEATEFCICQDHPSIARNQSTPAVVEV